MYWVKARLLTWRPTIVSKINKWLENFDERSHRRGRIFHRGDNVMWHQPVWSFPAGHPQSWCHRYWFLLHKASQYWLSMLFVRLHNPQNCPFPWGSRPPSNIWFLGPTWVYPPIGFSFGSAVLAGLLNTTNRHTYRQAHTQRQCYSICSSKLHFVH